ncbi:hypothetical protein BDB00DRAFT_808407 [Zychaea mexicana]|uniref:uncharacterized protein n=1 Tax=Zychaea mexicana TaxID=64656 RepID=UPI0022FDB1AC|nr:uncharacterized protein BDB00DRAFT_808407 [Zychaea mexicana]KAI9496701.1 hypothetical protein BDB00DRAFT_808407 [Zychaea mexicana]
MFAGHFSLALLFREWFPESSPNILCFGVAFLDIMHGLFAFVDLEGISKLPDDQAGALGPIMLRCDYTHSLVGAALLSVLYGYIATAATRRSQKSASLFFPGFVASFSHFVTDWLVHGHDLPLDPISRVIVGGTGLMETNPKAAFYLEAALCIFGGLYSPKDLWTLVTVGSILTMHLTSPRIMPPIYTFMVEQNDSVRPLLTGVVVPLLFAIPAVFLGYCLNRSKQQEATASDTMKKNN